MESRFLIRSVQESDLEELFRLSKLMYFINLPADREALKKKIQLSTDSFSCKIEDKFRRIYILVIEDLIEKRLVGTSSIIARHGSPESPHMYFQLKEIQKYSQTIHTGFIHKVLQLKFDPDGPTEIGGLVVDPSHRKNPQKVGRQISFARFLFIKMKRRWFKNSILSELLPIFTDKGESILWDALGRKFTNLSYQDADRLSRINKEFVTSLFPRGDIYTCLLPGEVRDAIGKVGDSALPVKHMLEKIGFAWKNQIDPFDGGPHYWADTDHISVIKATRSYRVASETLQKKTGEKRIGMCGIYTPPNFFCVQTPYEINHRQILLPEKTLETLELEPKHLVYLLPLTEDN